MNRPMCSLASAGLVSALIACGGGGDGDDGRGAAAAPTRTPTASGTAAPAGAPTPPRRSRDLASVDLQGVAVASDGTVFAADIGGSRVLRVDRRGRVFDFAGRPVVFGLEGDGGPVGEALLHGPTGLAVDADDNLYITDHGNNRIRKVDEEGTIRTVAGTGPPGTASGAFSGDGGPAIEARMHEPTAVAVDRDGRMFIADRDNYRVRAVDPEGTITTLAGSGGIGPARTEGPATEAALGLPVGVAAGPDGSVYIADELAHRVYEVDEGGVMSTFAGTGEAGYGGDGGPAADAELNGPYGLAADARGNVYIADLANQVIRVVDRTGTIRTVAGTGTDGSGRDGRPATRTALSGPYAVAVDRAGALYIADNGNAKVRRVGRSGRMTTLLP